MVRKANVSVLMLKELVAATNGAYKLTDGGNSIIITGELTGLYEVFEEE